jgi:hypothetical protein
MKLKTLQPISTTPRNYTNEVKEILSNVLPFANENSDFENPFEDEPEQLTVKIPRPEINEAAFSMEDLTALENHFNRIVLPTEIQLSQGEFINDVPAFIQSHLTRCRSGINKEAATPFYDRLQKLKTNLKQNIL